MKLCLVALALFLSGFTINSYAQRDYFTPEELELIRDAQQIDKRVEVEVHAMDRRFAALNVDVKAPAFKEKDSWGTQPGGSRIELLFDIKHILQKAIDDIDNLSERPTSMVMDEPADKKKKPKGFSDVFPAAVRSLGAAAERYRPAFKSALDTTKSDAEKGVILDSIDMCDEIIAAVAKLPTGPADPKKAQK